MHLLLRFLASLVSRGGNPRQDLAGLNGPSLLYPLRPGTFLFCLGCLAFLAYSLAHNLPLLLHCDLAHLQSWVLPLSLVFGVMSLSLLTRTLRLDERGLSIHYALSPDRLIPWPDLAHVELQHSRSSNRGTFFFRSRPHPANGQITTIVLPEMTYNVPQLLDEIRRRQPLDVVPYQRRHWYGG